MNFNLFKEKAQSIIFWLLYWLIQSVLMSGGTELDFYLIKNVVIVGLQFSLVYINFKWLFPQFFSKKKYVVYVFFSIVLIYTVFTFSFILIDKIFSLYYPNFIVQKEVVFAFDFWSILSGSSFYSLALVCSLVYMLLQTNQEKEDVNVALKKQLVNGIKKNAVIIKEGHKTHKVLVEDIYFVKGLKEYVIWHTENKNIIALQTMSGIASDYKSVCFLRVHKSYIVNMKHVNSFESNSLKVNNEIIPIGRAYKKNVTNFLKNE